MIPFMPTYSPTDASASGGLVASYLQNATATNLASSYTLYNLAMGAEASNRYILLATAAYGSTNSTTLVSSMSIGGIATTQLYATTAGRQSLSFRIALVPTGTYANVSVTFNRSVSCVSVSGFSLRGLNSLTPYATAGYNTTSTWASVSNTINVADGGAIFGIAAHTVTGRSIAFTNIDRTNDIGTSVLRIGMAGKYSMAAETNRTLMVSNTGGSGTGSRLFLSMR